MLINKLFNKEKWTYQSSVRISNSQRKTTRSSKSSCNFDKISLINIAPARKCQLYVCILPAKWQQHFFGHFTQPKRWVKPTSKVSTFFGCPWVAKDAGWLPKECFNAIYYLCLETVHFFQILLFTLNIFILCSLSTYS